MSSSLAEGHRSWRTAAEDAPYLVSLASNSFILPISTTLDWIFSGNLGRFPDWLGRAHS